MLRLASLLWRLRRATAIESGLFGIQARHLLQFQQTRKAYRERQKIIDDLHRTAVATTEPAKMEMTEATPDISRDLDAGSQSDDAGQFEDLTRSFIRLINLPTCPIDRLSRYEANLWSRYDWRTHERRV